MIIDQCQKNVSLYSNKHFSKTDSKGKIIKKTLIHFYPRFVHRKNCTDTCLDLIILLGCLYTEITAECFSE